MAQTNLTNKASAMNADTTDMIAKMSKINKIDIHCHTTNRIVEGVIPKSCTLDAISEEMKKYNVTKTVVLASYFPHKQSGISNFRLARWIQNRPEFVMFGSMDFEHYFYQGMNELTELADAKLIHGIKIYTCYQNVNLKSDKFKEVVKLADHYKLPVAFHCGYSYSSMHKYGRPAITEMTKASDLLPLMLDFPSVPFIISHMSKPFFCSLEETVNRAPNAYTDVSGLIGSRFEDDETLLTVYMIKRFIDRCGPDRLLFGTDFPVQTHDDSVYLVEEAMKTFSDSDKQLVYYDNAAKLLRLKE